MVKLPIYLIIGLGLVVAFIAGTQPNTPSNQTAKQNQTTQSTTDHNWATVQTGSWQPTLHAYGLISDAREVRISASIPIKVIQTNIELGQRVKQGQILAIIEAPALLEQLMRLDGQRRHINLLTKALEDVQSRISEHLTTNEELIRTTTELDLAKSEYDAIWQKTNQQLVSLGQEPDRQSIEKSLGSQSPESVATFLSKIICPIDGVVMQRRALPGMMMQANALLYSIEDVGSIYIDVGVLPSEVADWEGGAATATILDKDLSLTRMEAVPRLDPDTGLMLLRYRGVVPNHRQVDGAWVPVTVYGLQREVGWVPRRAVVARNGVTWCLVDDGNGKPKPVRVTVGQEVDKQIPIIKGIAPGKRVLIHNAYEVLYRDLNDLIQFQD